MELNEIMRGIAVGAIPLLFAITLPEVAHGWVASRLGAPTAKMMGRLSLNPIKHIVPVGTILVPGLMLLFSPYLFGWAKPVPVSFNRLNHPKSDMIFVALAGPLANLLLAILWVMVLKFTLVSGLKGGVAGAWLYAMAEIGIFINIILGAFKLLPIPPLDGGRVLRGLVPESIGRYLDRIEPFGLIILVVLLVSGFLRVLVGPIFSFMKSLIFFVTGL